MKGPYIAKSDRTIAYLGNRLFAPMDHVSDQRSVHDAAGWLRDFVGNGCWPALTRINNRIYTAANRYFADKGACAALLPLTTRMISSPGAVYGREALNYTTDTCPVSVDWFDLKRPIFLAESSQIYLELYLLQSGVDAVFCIYNSFRKERADKTHLSEFHHIEFEAHVDQAQNEATAIGLLQAVIRENLRHNESDLAVFLDPAALRALSDFVCAPRIARLSFRQALDILRRETGDDIYAEFSCQHFGAWEEVLLSQVLGAPCLVTQYPLLEVPFYHAAVPDSDPPVANNADLIWPGYREIIGSGQRIGSVGELESKAATFNLPASDYAAYTLSRQQPHFRTSSGFGLGWERLLQGMLCMPQIWTVAHMPRTHEEPAP